MRFKVIFQRKASNQVRPIKEVQDEVIQSAAFVPLPNVGDSVSSSFGQRGFFKVLTRHFLTEGTG
jgi:hypothetical protein